MSLRSSSRQPMSRRWKPSAKSIASIAAIGARAGVGERVGDRGDGEHPPAAGKQCARRMARGAGVEHGHAMRRARRPRRRRSAPPRRGRAGIAVGGDDRPSSSSCRSAPGASNGAPVATAISNSAKSPSMRGMIASHSGSPKRTLYSISLGPSAVSISPANSTPENGVPAVGHRPRGRLDDLAHGARFKLGGQDRARASKRPCRRCWGRYRPRRRACGPGRWRGRPRASPSTSANRLASSPSRNSSITIGPSPAAAIAASASARRHGDGHALARGEAVGLDHDGNGEAVERGQRFGLGLDADISGGRNPGARAQILGEALDAFEHRRGGARAEHGDARRRARRRRPRRRAAPRGRRRSGRCPSRCASATTACGSHGSIATQSAQRAMPGIAGRGDQLVAARRLPKPPRQRILAPARSQQQDVHAISPTTRRSPAC